MKYCLAVRTVTHHEPFLPVTSGRALLAFTLFVGSGAVLADEPAEKRWSISATVVSDYRFRGISQSWRESALQGGVEYGHPSGWYGGLWSSQISGNVYPGAQFEVDLYGGYKGSVSNGIGYNAGLLQYKYPGDAIAPRRGSRRSASTPSKPISMSPTAVSDSSTRTRSAIISGSTRPRPHRPHSAPTPAPLRLARQAW